RAIITEIREGRGIKGSDGTYYVDLDLTHLDPKIINEKLPEITGFARTYLGVEPTKEGVPVQPTAHYTMGGIPTDKDGHVLKNATLAPLANDAGEWTKKTVGDLKARAKGENCADIRTEMQNLMMEDVGIFRTEQGMQSALNRIAVLKERFKRVSIDDKGAQFN